MGFLRATNNNFLLFLDDTITQVVYIYIHMDNNNSLLQLVHYILVGLRLRFFFLYSWVLYIWSFSDIYFSGLIVIVSTWLCALWWWLCWGTLRKDEVGEGVAALKAIVEHQKIHQYHNAVYDTMRIYTKPNVIEAISVTKSFSRNKFMIAHIWSESNSAGRYTGVLIFVGPGGSLRTQSSNFKI